METAASSPLRCIHQPGLIPAGNALETDTDFPQTAGRSPFPNLALNAPGPLEPLSASARTPYPALQARILGFPFILFNFDGCRNFSNGRL